MSVVYRTRILAFLIVLLAVAVAAFAENGAAESPDPTESSTQAWFTEAQAERGSGLYRVHCAACHGMSLEGNVGPGLAGGELFGAWGNAYELYHFYSESMPPAAPGRLGDQVYTDILAYILSFNGYPAGENELKPDLELFKQVKLEPQE